MCERRERWMYKKHLVRSLDVDELKNLDHGDTALVGQKFDEVCELLHEIKVIGKAGCSQLVELVDTLRERDGDVTDKEKCMWMG